MKKIVLSAILIAATIGCSTINKDTEPDKESGRIRLGSSMSNMEAKSKAALNSTSAVTGLQMLRVDADTPPSDFTTASLVAANRVDDATSVVFATPQYYDSEQHSYFMGYYPAADASIPAERSWAIDGKTDIMTTDIYDAGTYGSPIVPKMRFKHALAQIELIITSETGHTNEVRAHWGNIVQIQTHLANNKASLKLNPISLVFSNPSEVPFLKSDYSSEFTSLVIPEHDNTEINAAGMFAPTGQKFQIILKVGALVSSPVIDVDLGSGNSLQAGKRYVITLVFNTKEIKVKATSIEAWAKGGNGAVEMT